MKRYDDNLGLLIRDGILAIIALIAMGMAGCPQYNVWQQALSGKAALERAEYERKIAIEEAVAAEKSAIHWANAEVARARGANKANSIMKESLGGNENYLRWLFIEKLDKIKIGQIIYLPTEAGLPILEAGKRE